MDLSILSNFGLNKNDIKVYETLIKNGRSKTGFVITSSGVSSSSVYNSLLSLIKRGLVSYQVKNNIKYYQAELPDQLKEDIKNQSQVLERLSKEISSFPIRSHERNEINVFQGVQGFKKAHEIMADEVQTSEEVRAITYSKYYGKSKDIRKFFSALDKKLLTQTKAKIKLLVDKDLKEIICSDRRNFIKKYEFRCLPKEHFNPCGFNISGSMVVIAVWGKNPIAFMIRNKAVIENFKTNFDFMWERAKR